MTDTLARADLILGVNDQPLKAGLAAARKDIEALGANLPSLDPFRGQTLRAPKLEVPPPPPLPPLSDEYGDELKRIRDAAVGVGRASDQAGASVSRLGKTIEDRLGARTRQVEVLRERLVRLQTLGGENKALDGLRAELRLRQQSIDSLKRLQEQERKRSAGIQVPERAVGTVGKVTTALAGLGAGIAIQQFFRESIQGAIELESITKRLSNTLGPQGAGKALSFTKGLADDLGLSFTTLASGFGSFTAAASAAGVPLETQRDLFGAVAKAGQQLGLSNDEISGSLLALQQVASKGTVSMEELRGQLGERLPIAFGAAARGLGITQKELIKLVETGQLTADRFFPALTKGLNELTSATAGAPTAAQNLQILANRWKELQVSFGQNLLPSVTGTVEKLVAVLDGLGRKGIADRLGFETGAVGALGFLSDPAIEAAESYKSLQRELNLTDKQADRVFSNAQKNLGIKNIGLAKPETVRRVIDEARRIGIALRTANPDRQDELSRQQALSKKLLEVELARSDAATKIVNPSKQQLKDTQALIGLKGLALSEAQEELKIEEARRALAKAQASERIARKQIGPDGLETAEVVTAAAKTEAAANAVRLALLEGSAALEEAAKSAADRFKDAVKQLTSARLELASTQADPNGLNQFLRPDEQFTRTRAAILSLGPELNKSLSAGQELLNGQGVGLGRDVFADIRAIFDNAVTGRSADSAGLERIQKTIQSVEAERDAIAGVNDAQKELAKINFELVTVNAGLAERVGELIRKDWQVSVVVGGDNASQVYGDAVNAQL